METHVRQKANQVEVALSTGHTSVLKFNRIRKVDNAFWAISEFGVRTACWALDSRRSQASGKRS